MVANNYLNDGITNSEVVELIVLGHFSSIESVCKLLKLHSIKLAGITAIVIHYFVVSLL